MKQYIIIVFIALHLISSNLYAINTFSKQHNADFNPDKCSFHKQVHEHYHAHNDSNHQHKHSHAQNVSAKEIKNLSKRGRLDNSWINTPIANIQKEIRLLSEYAYLDFNDYFCLLQRHLYS